MTQNNCCTDQIDYEKIKRNKIKFICTGVGLLFMFLSLILYPQCESEYFCKSDYEKLVEINNSHLCVHNNTVTISESRCSNWDEHNFNYRMGIIALLVIGIILYSSLFCVK